MTRVKRGVTTKKTHKKVLKQAKGYKLGRKKLIKQAREAVYKAGEYAYKHRKTKKRDMRRLWIIRINAGCHANGIKYSVFIKKLSDKKIELDRKILADLAMNEPEEFKKIVEKVKN